MAEEQPQRGGRAAAQGYTVQQWEGKDLYACTNDPCWAGTYSRVNTFNEAEMQAHQTLSHAPA